MACRQRRHRGWVKGRVGTCIVDIGTELRYKLAMRAGIQDRGCLEASKALGGQSRCVECPFEACLYENSKDGHPKMRGTMERQIRAKELRDMGKTPLEIAGEIGVHPRTIWRYLK